MKSLKILLFAAIILVSTNLLAQDIPKKGALIWSESSEIKLLSTQVTDVEIKIVRSKVERKRKFGVPIVQAPKGLEVTVTPTETPDLFVMSLKPIEIAPGNYNLIVKGGGLNKHIITGAMMSLVIEESATLSSSN